MQDLAAVLAPGEGVVTIGVSFLGTMLALVLADDMTGPVEAKEWGFLPRDCKFAALPKWPMS